MSITVKKVSEKYEITKQVGATVGKTYREDVKIHVYIEDGTLTIIPDNEHTKFEFRKSKASMVQDIAELMLEAVKLAKGEMDNA